MEPAELRRWIESRRAAAQREVQEAVRERAFHRDPIQAALALIAVAGRLHGWPVSEDATEVRETGLARERWHRLRKCLRGV